MEYQAFVFNLVFLVIWQCIAKGTSRLTIYQSPSVTGREGGTVILNCTLSVEGLGPVRWYKGENHHQQQQQLLYLHLTTDKSDPRVSRTVNEGPTRDTDHSITFTNITWDDAGVYYCKKFKSDKVTVDASGNGTQLYVTPKPSPPYSPPSLSGPIQQVRLNIPVTFNCTSAGFYPPEIHVTWWQNEKELPGAKSDVCSNDGNRTYQVKSTITVPAKIDSPVTCRINHTALKQPIHSTFNISNIVNAPSPPSFSGPDDKVLSNANVIIYCKSAGFYPKEISVIWEQDGNVLQGSKLDITLNGADKTYQALSNVTVTAKIDSNVTCRINHTALEQPTQSIFRLNDIVKAIPSTPEITYNKTDGKYILTCTSSGFYPENVSIQWTIDGILTEEPTQEKNCKTENGTYNVTSTVEVIPSGNNPSAVACEITFLGSILKSKELKLNISDSQTQDPAMIAGITCGVLGILFLITIISFLLLQKRKKEKTATPKSLNTSNFAAKQEQIKFTSNASTKQEQEQNDDVITYASLNLCGGDSQPRNKAHEEVTEYGQVKFKGEPDNEVTYADVSIAKPRKKKGASTKQASVPQYFVHESGTEYAAINIRSKAKK